MKKIFLGSIALIITIIGIFVAYPQAIGKLAFSGELFFGGDLWRIVTYPFAHISGMHLFENVLALFVLSLLAYELKLEIKEFLGLFVFSGIIIAFLGGILFPYLIIAGASLGIYSVFGGLTLKGRNIIPNYALPILFGTIIILNVVYNVYIGENIAQPIYHAAGFGAGIGLFKLTEIRNKRRVRILQ
jgi:membrane associated rhomboid family serine protease